jgi:hypothetical protein
MPVRVRKRDENGSDDAGDGAEEIVYARSCREGPVFNGGSVIWDGLDLESEPATSDETEEVAPDQAELSPGGEVRRQTVRWSTQGENPPPGN